MNGTVDYLKDNITNLLFTVTLIEGIGCTFAQTEQIVERGECEGLDSNDITKLINFKRALEFLVEECRYPVELGTLMEYNAILGEGDVTHPNPGYIRDDIEVHISKCSYTAPPISENEALALLNEYREYDNPIDQFAYLALVIPKAQMFYDGNKRTSLLACNHVLCYNNLNELFMLDTEEKYKEYIYLLLDYYEGEIALDDAMYKMRDFLQ